MTHKHVFIGGEQWDALDSPGDFPNAIEQVLRISKCQEPPDEGRYHYQLIHAVTNISPFVMKSKFQALLSIVVICIIMEGKGR